MTCLAVTRNEALSAAAESWLRSHQDEWRDILDVIDPDWASHYVGDPERAMRDYREYAVKEVVRQIEGGDIEIEAVT